MPLALALAPGSPAPITRTSSAAEGFAWAEVSETRRRRPRAVRILPLFQRRVRRRVAAIGPVFSVRPAVKRVLASTCTPAPVPAVTPTSVRQTLLCAPETALRRRQGLCL